MPEKKSSRGPIIKLGNSLLCAAVAMAVVFSSPVFSEETRQLKSHEHGVGELNIAVDGNIIAIELHAPGADIVGFEYVAETVEDLRTIEMALTTLSQPLELFAFSPAAECRVTDASAHRETEGFHEDHAGHEEQGHTEDHGGHADHEEHKGKDDGMEGSVHSGFHATYTLTCNKLGALSEITFAYFNVFENSLELDVQLLSDSGAQAFKVERGNPTLDLTGMF